MHPFKTFLWIVTFAVFCCGCSDVKRKPISVIAFDVGGVLSSDMIETKLTDLASAYGLDAHSLLEVKNRYRDPADLGTISDKDFWYQILNHFGVKANEKDAEIDSYIVLVEGTMDIAKTLSRKYRIAILSNDSKEMSALRIKKFNFDAIFNPIIISCNFGIKKPDAEIYRILLKELGSPAEDCLFIDNSQTNVDAARALGFQTIVFKNAEQLRKDLLSLGIKL
jgi:HAD superfamily hydrolase (TIGR01509 family)